MPIVYQTKDFKKISIKNKKIKDFFEGVNDLPYLCSYSENGTTYKFRLYKIWKNMMERCYSGLHPAYKDCTVSVEWLTCSNFIAWAEENYIDGYEIDKDLMVPGNKVHSPETCVFVKPWLNKFHTHTHKNQVKKSGLPRGIFNSKDGKFRAQPCGISKSFNTVDEALEFYKTHKVLTLISRFDDIPEKLKPSIIRDHIKPILNFEDLLKTRRYA